MFLTLSIKLIEFSKRGRVPSEPSLFHNVFHPLHSYSGVAIRDENWHLEIPQFSLFRDVIMSPVDIL